MLFIIWHSNHTRLVVSPAAFINLACYVFHGTRTTLLIVLKIALKKLKNQLYFRTSLRTKHTLINIS